MIRSLPWKIAYSFALAMSFTYVCAALVWVSWVHYSPNHAFSHLEITPFHIPLLVSFLVASLWLLTTARQERSVAFATIFALTAAGFSFTPLEHLGTKVAVFSFFYETQVFLPWDAVLPVIFWRFTQMFPRTYHHILDSTANQGLWITCTLFGLLLIAGIGRLFLESDVPILNLFARENDRSLYWLLVYAPIVIGVIFLVAKSFWAARSERMRFTVFMSAVLVTNFPLVFFGGLAAVSPSFGNYITSIDGRWIVQVCQALLLAMPFTTAYAILVNNILPVHRLLKKTAMRLLAKQSLGMIALLTPLAIVCLVLLGNHTLVGLLSDVRVLFGLGISLLLLFLALPLSRVIDDRFGHNTYDPSAIQSAYKSSSFQSTNDVLCGLNSHSVGALLPDISSVGWLCELTYTDLADGKLINLSPEFAKHLHTSTQPLELSAEKGYRGQDRRWVQNHRFHISCAVPTPTAHHSAILFLGYKKSGESYSEKDYGLIEELCHIAEHAIEKAWTRHKLPVDRDCQTCGAVYRSTATECPDCGTVLEKLAIQIPQNSKYTLISCIGLGGEGKVYKGTQRDNNSYVAIKTARAPQDKVFLEAEARTLAKCNHPNLATIFQLEYWQNTPIMVMEYLEEGTLSDRVLTGVLDEREVIRIGKALISGLQHLHAQGIVHGDIKLSNIGFSKGVPKLLDFGLSHTQKPGTNNHYTNKDYVTLISMLLSALEKTQNRNKRETGLTEFLHLCLDENRLAPEHLSKELDRLESGVAT